jgi:hypothetical protein
MTNFNFEVSDLVAAKEAIKIIDKKFNSNEQAKKILYRDIKQIKDNVFSCEFVFPFPDLRFPAKIFLAINLIIFYFFRHLWIFSANIVLFAAAYRIRYMTSSKYYFKMLSKGMKKNGYKGTLKRI